MGLSAILNTGICAPAAMRNTDAVIEERPEQILMNIPENLARKAYRRRNIADTRLHQHNISRIERNIGSSAYCNTRIRLSERRSIVYAVADHGDRAVLLELFDYIRLVTREHI